MQINDIRPEFRDSDDFMAALTDDSTTTMVKFKLHDQNGLKVDEPITVIAVKSDSKVINCFQIEESKFLLMMEKETHILKGDFSIAATIKYS